METIGQQLKQTREQANKSLEDIHRLTKISVAQLKLIEEGNLTFLPATYMKSFLSTYAKSLGIDAEEVLKKYHDFQSNEQRTKEKRDASDQVVKTDRKLEWSLGLAALLLLLGLVFAYLKYNSDIAPVAAQNQAGFSASLAQTESGFDFRNANTNVPLDSLLDLKVTALEQVWLQITIDDQQVEEYTLAPGSDIDLVARARYDILVENAGGIKLRFKGQELPKVGAAGVPMRLVFEKDGLKQKKITNLNRPQH